MSQGKLITYREASERTGLPRGTLSRWVHEGRLPHVRLGPRTIRFDVAELDRWIDEHRVDGRRGDAA